MMALSYLEISNGFWEISDNISSTSPSTSPSTNFMVCLSIRPRGFEDCQEVYETPHRISRKSRTLLFAATVTCGIRTEMHTLDRIKTHRWSTPRKSESTHSWIYTWYPKLCSFFESTTKPLETKGAANRFLVVSSRQKPWETSPLSIPRILWYKRCMWQVFTFPMTFPEPS